MYKAIKDNENRIIQFIPTTHETVEIETRVEKPADEIGFDWIEKVKEQDGKWVTEWVKIERELTEQEKILKRLGETEGAVQEIAMGMLGGGM